MGFGMKKAAFLSFATLLLVGCGDGDYAAKPPEGPRPGPNREFDPDRDESLFGEGGLSLTRVFTGDAFRTTPGETDALPVNKFLWQASLDTLSFLPLSSTDPFTGVIATDWSAAPNQPGERFKVTAYMLSPALAASSLKVAVYREVRDGENGVWVPASVNPETPRQIEDAILTRARQIRIADVEGQSTG
jgi:hypothetical protein